MKVSYDQEVDVAYIQLSSHKPDGGVELANGVVLHTTATDEIVGIEILNAKTRISLNSLYQYELKQPTASAPRQIPRKRVGVAGVGF
jgi:uncharacterized protein YuzE